MRRGVMVIAVFWGFLFLLYAAQAIGGATSPPGVDGKEWQELVTKAQKEGTVSVYSTYLPAETRKVVQQAFKKKYSINVEYTAGTGGEIAQKFKTEWTAGLRIVDLFHVGIIEFRDMIKPMKVTIPIEPLLMLPEVVNHAKWRGGRLPYLDADKHAFMLVLLADNFYVIKTDLVKMDEIRSTLDVLNPKWKGKIILLDPTIPGNSNAWFVHTIVRVLGQERGEKFMRDLLLKQEPTVVRDSRQAVEGVARGKYPLVIGASVTQPVEFIRNGAPIAFAKLNEPTYMTAGTVIFSIKEVPHPNAAKLFTNWIVSREGSSLYAPSHGYPSARLDVSTEGFVPAIIPGPADRSSDTEEYMAERARLMKLAVDIFKGTR